MVNKYLCFVCALMLFGACSSEKGDTKSRSYFVDYQENSVFNWDELFSVEEVIPLETNEECLLSYATKCIVAGDKIVYLDSKQKALFVFSTKGEFLYKIDALGGGDKEYTEIKDMEVSYDKQSILILDYTSVLVFDIKSGAFQKRISLNNEDATDFYCLAECENEQLYFWSAGKKNSLYTLTNKELYPIKERDGYPFICQKFYFDAENRLNVLSDYGRYEIYTLSGDSLQTKHSFDFGKWNLPANLNIQTSSEWDKIETQPYFKSLLSAFETGKELFLGTVDPNRNLYFIVADKASGKILSGKQNRAIPIAIMGADKDCFYGIIYPSLFTEKSSYTELIKQYNVSDDSNPLIVRLKVKNNPAI